MKAVMLVGGEGTRLRPFTDTMPKHLLPVGNRPFLEHVMAWLAKHGVTEAIFTTGYKAEAFEGFDATHGVKLSVVVEKTLLGTAGAVRNVLDRLDDTFLVINGDILTTLDLSDLIDEHKANKAEVTISLSRVSDPSAYGLVPTDDSGAIEGFIEKPEEGEEGFPTDWINAGTYAMEPSVLEEIPPNTHYMFERGLFPSLVQRGAAMFGFQSDSYWLDVGTPAKYLKANFDVIDRRAGLEPPGNREDSGAWIGNGVAIHPSAMINGPSAVGAASAIGRNANVGKRSCVAHECAIGEGVEIGDSVLHERVAVSSGTRIFSSIIGTGAEIGEGCNIDKACIGPGAKIGDGVVVAPGTTVGTGEVLSSEANEPK